MASVGQHGVRYFTRNRPASHENCTLRKGEAPHVIKGAGLINDGYKLSKDYSCSAACLIQNSEKYMGILQPEL